MPTLAPRTVLIVDDEPEIRLALETALRRDIEGVRVLQASDAEEGLRTLLRETVHVVLSDHRMPGKDGVAFLADARREAPDAARILMTGYTSGDLAVRAINEARVERFLAKPFGMAEAVAIVRDALRDAAPDPVGPRAIPRPFRGDLTSST